MEWTAFKLCTVINFIELFLLLASYQFWVTQPYVKVKVAIKTSASRGFFFFFFQLWLDWLTDFKPCVMHRVHLLLTLMGNNWDVSVGLPHMILTLMFAFSQRFKQIFKTFYVINSVELYTVIYVLMTCGSQWDETCQSESCIFTLSVSLIQLWPSSNLYGCSI